MKSWVKFGLKSLGVLVINFLPKLMFFDNYTISKEK